MNIFGASGHAKVVIECLEDAKIPISAVIDNDILKTEIFNYLVNHQIINNGENFVIAIGDNKIRKNIVNSNDFKYGIAVHPSAIISLRSTIGVGTVVFHRALVQVDVKIGEHCIINTAATIDHDCKIGDFVHIAPGVTICGNVQIGDLTIIGAGSTILPNLTIGKNCIIGAGSVVIDDIPDNSKVVGNPAKLRK